MKKKLARVLSLALAVCMMASCGSKSPAAPSEPAESSKPAATEPAEAEEKVLTIGNQYTLATLNPLKATADGDRYVLCNIYESLVEYDSAGKFVPGFAESWETEDELTWVFHLKDDSYWHTGNELFKDEKVKVTAEDVKTIFEMTMDEANESAQRAAVSSNIESIEVIDETTIKFVTKIPDAYFLSTLANVYLFPPKAIEEGFDLNKTAVGSGPYKFVSYATDDEVVLEKNADFAIEPGLDKVIFKIIPDKSVLAIALQNKEIDLATTIVANDIAAVLEDDDLTVVANASGWYRYMGFNFENELFKDKDIRKAICMAIDVDSAIAATFKNDAGVEISKRAYGPIPLEFVGANEEEWKKVAAPYDPEGAKALIESKGFKLNANGIYEKDGKELTFSLKSANYDPNMKFGIIVATQLKAIGVNCVSEPTEWATLLADLKASNKDAFIMGGGSTLTGMNSLFHSVKSKGQSHGLNYVNLELDAKLDEAFATMDEAARAALLTEASCMAVEDCAELPLFFEYAQWGMNKRVKDFEQVPALYFSLTNGQRNVTVE